MSKRIIIWTTGIDELKSSNKIVGGLTVQMSIWASTFLKNNWETYSFTKVKTNNNKVIDGIFYMRLPHIYLINIIIEPLLILSTLIKTRPNAILLRGASRSILPLSILSKFFGVKIIFMLASNTDVIIGKELIQHHWDKLIYRIGLKLSTSFVAQNIQQKKLLQKNYHKSQIIIIPNIWENHFVEDNPKRDNILWVSNFRSLKRPEWFLEISRHYPNYNFVMIGAPKDSTLYNICEEKAKSIPNIEFKGSQPLAIVNQIFSSARLLICTSEIEGFPNTFLQAWANNIPVISTFDPSNLIQDKGLGLYAEDLVSLIEAVKDFDNQDFYKQTQNNIIQYFKSNHDTVLHYNRLLEFFKI